MCNFRAPLKLPKVEIDSDNVANSSKHFDAKINGNGSVFHPNSCAILSVNANGVSFNEQEVSF